MTDKSNLTPAMAQYYDMKNNYPDSVLFFRMGDFYEMFGEDAHIAHKVLGISITSRNKNSKNPEALAGIPYHAKEKYLPTLVEAGYKVAIAEQVSDPKLKGIVKREVVRVVTPATLSLEGETYEKSENETNYILAICEEKGSFAISFLDISSNTWKTSEFSSFSDLSNNIYKVGAKEVILEKDLFSNTNLKNLLTKKYTLNIYFFSAKEKARENLLNHFKTKNLEGFGIEKKPLAIKASSMLLEYINSNQKTDLSFLDSISYDSFSSHMDIDESTLRNLDIIYNFSTKSSKIGTLFGVLDDTKTAMGTRFLKESILSPLQDLDEINRRQDIVECFYDNPILLDKVRSKLKTVSDIDSILNRLALNRANPRDLLSLKKSLQSVLEAVDVIKTSGNDKLIKLLGI